MKTIKDINGIAFLPQYGDDVPAGLKRYFRDQLKAAAADRAPVLIGGRAAYYVKEAAAVMEAKGEKIGEKYGAAAVAAIRQQLQAIRENHNAADDEADGPTVDALLRQKIAELSNERAANAAAALELAEYRDKLKNALQANAEIKRAERAANGAAAVAERDKAAALNEVRRLAEKNRNGAEKLKAAFTSPVFLFVPLCGILAASFVHMGIVFSSAFASSFGAWSMSAVFSSVVLIFTFNSKGRAGAMFAAAFAVVEFLVNGVYFDFLPPEIIPATAAVALPVAVLAYVHLFTFTANK